MKPIGVAVVGAGFWGRNQIRIFSQIPQSTLLAVCDTDRKALQKVRSSYQVDTYTEIEQILERDDIYALTVCTPTLTHYNLAHRIIEAGKHLLVEKPLTSTTDEAKKIIALAKKRGVSLFVGFVERFNPAVRYLKTFINQKRMGNVILLMARRVTRWPVRIGDIGVTKDSAIHDVDIMRFLLNSEVSHVYARVGSLKHRHEDFSEIMVKFQNGVIGFIDANWLTPRKIRKLVVTGSEATAIIDYITQEVTLEDASKSTRPRLRWEEPLHLELENFATSIIKRMRPSPDGLDGLKALKVCEAALRSSREEKVVKIK
ncbi:Gfo/Idh/MocA family protein [[Eubacterium] cellulosolvens]